MMDRKTFLKRLVYSGAGLLGGAMLSPSRVLARNKEQTLTILHTNDLMSQIDPLPDTAGRYAGRGGMERLTNRIKEIRGSQPNSLLLDAGNMLGRTAYFEKYRGELMMRLMSRLDYNAAIIGSRELEVGVNTFMDAYRFAEFPFVCSNYDVKRSSLRFALSDYIIRQVNEIRVGIFGLGIDPEDYLPADDADEVQFRNPILVAQGMQRVLRHHHECDVVVCLSHLGYRYEDNRVDDLYLAKQVPGVDIIIGGHTRTLLEQPRRVEHEDGSFTVVNQVGYGGVALGRLDITVGEREKRIEGQAMNIGVDDVHQSTSKV